ncbi:MAG: hypothetical protein KGL94_06250 [Acidobacteriota bacterium]|nr:hypothetical protein [Acidobacteriota bacterium]
MPRIASASAATCAFALLAAGCGGGGKSPGVATLASGVTAPATTTSQSGPGLGVKPFAGPAGGSAGGQFRLSMNTGSAANGEKFSVCMRKHGVPNYPDPNGQGVITIDSGMGIDPGSPAFQSAQAACRKVLPNGGLPTPAQIAKQQRQLLAFSACMRAHGVKDFPDPSNGGLRVVVHPGSDLDPTSPTFQKAKQACRKNMPFKGG